MRLGRRIAAACALVLLGAACGGNVPAPDEPAAGAVVVPSSSTTAPVSTSGDTVPGPPAGTVSLNVLLSLTWQSRLALGVWMLPHRSPRPELLQSGWVFLQSVSTSHPCVPSASR